MKKLYLILSLCLMNLLSYSAYAQPSSYVLPFNVIPVPQSPTTVEQLKENLNAQHSTLQNQLTNVNAHLNLIDNFLNAQKALPVSWVDANNRDVSKDFQIDLNNKKLQLCQTNFLDGTHPGVLVKGGCLITYGGDSLVRQNYNVLQGSLTTQWQTINSITDYQLDPYLNQNVSVWQSKAIPIQGGYEKGASLYFCKVTYNGQDYIGKTVGQICDFAVGGKEVYLNNYVVLFGNKN